MHYRVSALLLALAVSGCASTEPMQSCGWLYSVEVTPVGRDIHPLTVDAINGDNVNPRSLRQLAVGSYELKVYEQIQDPRLAVNARHRGHSQTLQVEVAEGQIYYLGARFLPDKRYSTQNDYWQPVVWKQEARPCP